jgi:hypothetical protein
VKETKFLKQVNQQKIFIFSQREGSDTAFLKMKQILIPQWSQVTLSHLKFILSGDHFGEEDTLHFSQSRAGFYHSFNAIALENCEFLVLSKDVDL